MKQGRNDGKVKIKVFPTQIIVVCVLLLLMTTAFFRALAQLEMHYGKINMDTANAFAEPDRSMDEVYYQGKWYVPRAEIETMLLIGLDEYEQKEEPRGYSNSEQADFLALVVLDSKNKTYSVLPINRDTIVTIPTIGVRGEQGSSITGQIALSHTVGSGGSDSCRNTADTVSKLLYGMEIDHFLSFTMEAVPKVNDMVGGVPLIIADDLSALDSQMKKGVELTLSGEQALAYVRSRKNLADASNRNRMKRQQQYLEALRPRFFADMEQDENFLMNCIGVIADDTVSDCTANQLADFCQRVADAKDNGFLAVEGTSRMGKQYMEFYPDEEKLMSMVISLGFEPQQQ